MAGPVQQISAKYDSVTQNKMCKNVDRYLSEEKYDTGRIEKMLVDKFGREEVTKTTDELEQRF